MLVFLSKFLPLFVYPLGLACLLLGLALVLYRLPRLRTALIAAALLILIVGGNRWVAVSLVRSLEWRYLPPRELPRAEAIVVLGGGTEPAQAPRSSTEVNGGGDRVLQAARLYRQGSAPHILLSGGNITWMDSRSATPAQDMAELLQLMGVPPEALWLQDASRNTSEDALYSSRMLKEKGILRVVLVTSAMHMPRSVALFARQGIEVIPAPADYTVTEAEWQDLAHPNLPSFLLDLVPTASNLEATSGVLKEYIGMAVYRLQDIRPEPVGE
jgi:uncharacterized SAM-binding protein YcdF (DUF218 family)